MQQATLPPAFPVFRLSLCLPNPRSSEPGIQTKDPYEFLKFIHTFMNDNGPSIDRMRSPHPRQIVMNVHHSSAWAACIYVSQITNMPLLQGRTLITLCNCSLVTLLSGAPCVLLKGLKCPPAALQPSLRSPNWWTWNPWTPGVRPSISPEKLDFMLYCGDVVLKSDSLSAPWSGPYLYLTSNIALEKKSFIFRIWSALFSISLTFPEWSKLQTAEFAWHLAHIAAKIRNIFPLKAIPWNLHWDLMTREWFGC